MLPPSLCMYHMLMDSLRLHAICALSPSRCNEHINNCSAPLLLRGRQLVCPGPPLSPSRHASRRKWEADKGAGGGGGGC